MGLFDFFRKKSKPSANIPDAKTEPTDIDISKYKQSAKRTLDIIKAETETPCVRLELTDRKPSIFESKLGGIGYVPRNENIPAEPGGYQLTLLAQIDCSEVKLEEFPDHGLLQFWISDNDVYGLNFKDGTMQDTFRIIYRGEIDRSVTEEEVTAKIESKETDIPVNGEFGLSFHEEKNSMSDNDFRFYDLFNKKIEEIMPDCPVDDPNDVDEIQDIIADLNIEGFGHKIGGYPAFTQYDPRSDYDPRSYEEYDFLLLQLDSDYDGDNVKMMWGDSGICNFFINREKLKQCDFSDILYNWDCY